MDDKTPVPSTDDSLTVSGSPEWSGERPWLAHYHEGVPQTVNIPTASLAILFDQAVSRYGASAAIEYYGATISYAQLGSLAEKEGLLVVAPFLPTPLIELLGGEGFQYRFEPGRNGD